MTNTEVVSQINNHTSGEHCATEGNKRH